jgi:Na+-driven multidrug efflux pump
MGEAATGDAFVSRHARTERLLRGPVLGTLVRLAGPNVLMTTAQASTGLIETDFIAHLGTDTLGCGVLALRHGYGLHGLFLGLGAGLVDAGALASGAWLGKPKTAAVAPPVPVRT